MTATNASRGPRLAPSHALRVAGAGLPVCWHLRPPKSPRRVSQYQGQHVAGADAARHALAIALALAFALALALGRAYSPGELLSCWLKAEELVEHPPVFTELLIGVVTAGSLQHGHHAGLATLEAVLGQDRALNRQIECRALCLPAVALVALAVLLLQLPELGLEVLVGKTFIQLPLQLQCRFKREGWPARGTCLHCILGLRSLGH
mmetsp:Transcript_77551/g.241045  ORF Transcript_77551/g.241045 Transcript_77551/m.241045 type:complete len:206 (+) Transcript_77551:46-663(+)